MTIFRPSLPTKITYFLLGLLTIGVVFTGIPRAAHAANVPVSISCTATAVRDSLNHIYAWDLKYTVHTNNGVRVRIDAGGAAAVYQFTGTGPTITNTKRVNGVNLGIYSFSAQAVNPDTGGSSCQGTANGNGGTPPPNGPPPPPTSQSPQGSFDAANCSTISGWAFDPDASSESIYVEVFRDGESGGDGVSLGRFLANSSRPDVNAAFGISGNHGFAIPTPASVKDGDSHTLYVYAVDTTPGWPLVQITGSGRAVSCPSAPACPSGFTVALDKQQIEVGETATAFAPSGWTGGSFVSSTGAVSIASVPAGGSSAQVTGVQVGASTISGSGWFAPNGAEGCGLNPWNIVVTDPNYSGQLTATSPVVCSPGTVGDSQVTARANVYTEVRVYNATVADGTVLFTTPANAQTTRQTGMWVKEGTIFKLIAPLNGNKELSTVSAHITPKTCASNPIVDLKINGSDGPLEVMAGTTLTLAWTSQNADSCSAPEWTNSTATSGSDTALAGRTTLYSITCSNTEGDAHDSVQVIVKQLPPPVEPPDVESWVYNTSTASAGLTVDCGQIYAVWTKAEKPVDGYKIYYYNQNSASWTSLLTVPAAEADAAPGGKLGKVFAPPTTQNAYRYRVYTYRGATEGVALRDASGSPIASVPCDLGEGDLSPSNKDIIRIRNKDLDWDAKTTQDHAIEPALPIVAGDTVKFAINLVNGGTSAISTPIKVDDLLTNIVKPSTAGGFNLAVSCEANGQCQLKNVAYDPSTSRLSMIVAPTAGNSLAPLSGEVWTITFTGKTQAPIGQAGRPFRFRNVACLNLPASVACEKEVTTPLLVTPYILVLPVGAPTFEEIQ